MGTGATPLGFTHIPLSYHYSSPGTRTSMGTPALYRGLDMGPAQPLPLPLPLPMPAPGPLQGAYSSRIAAGTHLAAVMSRGGTVTNIPMHHVGAPHEAAPRPGGLTAALLHSASTALAALSRRPSSQAGQGLDMGRMEHAEHGAHGAHGAHGIRGTRPQDQASAPPGALPPHPHQHFPHTHYPAPAISRAPDRKSVV